MSLIRAQCGIGLALVVASGCADATMGGRRESQPAPEALVAYARLNAELERSIDAYLESFADSEGRIERTAFRTELGRRSLALRRLRPQAAAQMSPPHGPRYDSYDYPSIPTIMPYEVDAPGLFVDNMTFTDIDLWSEDVYIFNQVTIPAVIQVDVAGTVTSNGQSFPIAHTESTAPFLAIGWLSTFDLEEVDCMWAPASATAATQHTAGWHVRGFGFVPAVKRTTHFDSCDPTPCPNNPLQPFETGYDPYSSEQPNNCEEGQGGGEGEGSGTQYEPGDLTGGETVDFGTGQGNGGASLCGTAAMVDFVCFDIWNEVTEEWDGWVCGYITTC